MEILLFVVCGKRLMCHDVDVIDVMYTSQHLLLICHTVPVSITAGITRCASLAFHIYNKSAAVDFRKYLHKKLWELSIKERELIK